MATTQTKTTPATEAGADRTPFDRSTLPALLRAGQPSLFPQQLAALPPIFQLVHKLLTAVYTCSPRTLVREEKNKASGYHGSATNLTVYLERDKPVGPALAAIGTAFRDHTFTMAGWTAAFAFAIAQDSEAWSTFVANTAPAQADTTIGPNMELLDTPQGKFVLTHKPFKVLVTEEAFALNPADEAYFLACITRLMELTIAPVLEFNNNSTDGDLAAHNTAALQRSVEAYAFFLFYILRVYLEAQTA